RKTSNIHPNLRLNNRFLSQLFKLKELRSLNTIPTNQAPLIPQNFPDLIKFPVWGFRSKIDHFLINRILKSKDNNRKYRLFKSLNWVKIYQNPDMERNLKDYFHCNHLGKGLYNHLRDRALKRKNLEQWP